MSSAAETPINATMTVAATRSRNARERFHVVGGAGVSFVPFSGAGGSVALTRCVGRSLTERSLPCGAGGSVPGIRVVGRSLTDGAAGVGAGAEETRIVGRSLIAALGGAETLSAAGVGGRDEVRD